MTLELAIRRKYLLTLAFCWLPVLPVAANGVKLAKAYDQWLTHDVSYIITSEEKQAFLNLASDQDRDSFIARFWEIRNPTPGAPDNSYREEHYRRLSYAGQYFGSGSANDGWKSDRGQVYITLGEPQQRAYYREAPNVRPIEIWFYQNAHAALPPFFYVVFYRRDSAGDYRLYSPYADGPQKLVNTLEAGNDRVRSLGVIKRSLGPEVARTVLSLLPDEPVNLNDGVSSLQSDVLLSTIKNLANHPLTKDEINNRRRLLEEVTHRIILGDESTELLAAPLRDPSGEYSLHYLFRLKRPQDLSMTKQKDRYFYSVGLLARVLSSQGKPIYSEEKSFSRYLDEDEFQEKKSKSLGIEGRLPIAPGRYKLEFVLTNKISQTAYRVEKDASIRKPDGPAISELVPFTNAAASTDASASLPFSAPNLKFTPLGAQELSFHPGEDLKFFYQVWMPPSDPVLNRGKKLEVDYAYGNLGVHDGAKTIHEELPREQFDPAGTILSGKKIPTLDLLPGNYRLRVTITDPETHRRAYGLLGFRIILAGPAVESWTVYSQDEEARRGLPDYQRGLSYLSNGDQGGAFSCFLRALEKEPGNEAARSKVVEQLFAEKRFAQIPSLFARAGITAQTDELTILQFAESVSKTGDTPRAIALLESALNLKPVSAPLYLSLADYYQLTGNGSKAAELRRKGQAIAAPRS